MQVLKPSPQAPTRRSTFSCQKLVRLGQSSFASSATLIINLAATRVSPRAQALSCTIGAILPADLSCALSAICLSHSRELCPVTTDMFTKLIQLAHSLKNKSKLIKKRERLLRAKAIWIAVKKTEFKIWPRWPLKSKYDGQTTFLNFTKQFVKETLAFC